MNTVNVNILTINAGSSSIKMALYEMGNNPVLKLSGKIERIGSDNSTLIIKQNDSKNDFYLKANDFYSTTVALIDWLKQQPWFKEIKSYWPSHCVWYASCTT